MLFTHAGHLLQSKALHCPHNKLAHYLLTRRAASLQLHSNSFATCSSSSRAACLTTTCSASSFQGNAKTCSSRSASQLVQCRAVATADVSTEDGLWLVVGLGNPGPNYDTTRHNVGFEVIDLIAKGLGVKVTKIQDGAAIAKTLLHGKQVLLCKPMTFMNNSGEPLQRLAKYYKVPPQRILVIYDDLDLDTGVVRFRMKGGHGGHNGMRSIIQRLGGTQDFPRIRIGISRPPGQQSVASYVLEPFKKAERTEIEFAVHEAASVVKAVLTIGVEQTASGVRV